MFDGPFSLYQIPGTALRGLLPSKGLNQLQKSLLALPLDDDVDIFISRVCSGKRLGVRHPRRSARCRMFGYSGDLQGELELGSCHGRNADTDWVLRELFVKMDRQSGSILWSIIFTVYPDRLTGVATQRRLRGGLPAWFEPASL